MIQKQKDSVKFFAWLCMMALVTIFLVNAMGCSSMSLAKHKKVVWNTGVYLEKLANIVKEGCNENRIPPELCHKLLGEKGRVTSLFILYDIYTDILFEWQDKMIDPNTIEVVFENRTFVGIKSIALLLTSRFTLVVTELVNLGIIDKDKAKSLGVNL